jgi:ribonucleoside-diphosphate reductase alpha chain
MTTGQPGGTLPKVPSISPGCSRNRGPFYIRRVRYNKTDALAQVLAECGYPVYPEFAEGTTINSRNPAEFDNLGPGEQAVDLASVSVWVVEFPMKSLAKARAVDEDARDQLYRYLSYQNYWTDHNTSVTIYVGDDEWDGLSEDIHRHWEDGYIGISFSTKDFGSSMYILPPEEDIDEQEYTRRAIGLRQLDRRLLNDLESSMERTAEDETAGMQPCEGACALPSSPAARPSEMESPEGGG